MFLLSYWVFLGLPYRPPVDASFPPLLKPSDVQLLSPLWPCQLTCSDSPTRIQKRSPIGGRPWQPKTRNTSCFEISGQGTGLPADLLIPRFLFLSLLNLHPRSIRPTPRYDPVERPEPPWLVFFLRLRREPLPSLASTTNRDRGISAPNAETSLQPRRQNHPRIS